MSSRVRSAPRIKATCPNRLLFLSQIASPQKRHPPLHGRSKISVRQNPNHTACFQALCLIFGKPVRTETRCHFHERVKVAGFQAFSDPIIQIQHMIKITPGNGWYHHTAGWRSFNGQASPKSDTRQIAKNRDMYDGSGFHLRAPGRWVKAAARTRKQRRDLLLRRMPHVAPLLRVPGALIYAFRRPLSPSMILAM
jgi:hypothetical protein